MSAPSVIERWTESGSLPDQGSPCGRRANAGLSALVGQAGAARFYLDLRLHGPHALVGGTMGAGKSEFLQSWVLGMASTYSPHKVTFLFRRLRGWHGLRRVREPASLGRDRHRPHAVPS